MANDRARNPPRKQPYTLYAAKGRVYARNAAQKVIDLGPLARADGGGFCYLLDGNKLHGEGFATEEAALRDIAGRLHFLWLDGQFTAVGDSRAGPDFDLTGATELEIMLDELAPGERMLDATA